MNGATVFQMVSGLGDAFGGAFSDARKQAQEEEAPTLISNLMNAYKGGGAVAAPSVPGAGSPAQPGPVASAPTFAATGGAMGDYLATTRAKESGGNDLAANPNSTALGRYQFTKDTWGGLARKYPDLGLTPNGRTDPAQQERAMQAFTRENAQALTSAGITINPQNLYGAHFLGAGGATKFIPGAINSPDVPAASLVTPGAARANRTVFFNKDGSPKTAGEVYAWMGGRRGGGSAPAPSPVPTQVASAEPDAANLPAVGAKPAGFVIPEGGAATAAAQSPTGFGTRMTPELQTALNAAWKNPNTRAVASQVFSSMLTGKDTSWSIQDLGNGRRVMFDQKSGRMVPIEGTGDSFSTETDGDGNLIQVNAATGKREILKAGREDKFTYQNMDGIGMVALHPSDPGRSRVIIAGQQPRPLTDEEYGKFRIPEGTGAGMGADGKPFTLGGAPKTTVNIDNKGAGKFSEKANEHQAKRYGEIVDASDNAVRMRGDIETLSNLGAQIATGRGAQVRLTLAQFAKAAGLDGVADGLTGGKLGEMEAFGAIADRLTPQMRVPGSGATSDMEMRTFRNAIPSLLKTPEGNKIVSDTFRGLLDYQGAAGEIAGRALRGEISQAEADQALRSLPAPFERFKGYQRDQSAPKPTASAEPGAKAPPPSGPVSIPMAAVRALRSDPNLRSQFDTKYGAGASARILGPVRDNGPDGILAGP